MQLRPVCAFAQTANSTATASEPAADRFEFEVASVKPTDVSKEIVEGVRVYPGGRLEIRGYPLDGLIRLAFRPFRIFGESDWILETRYEVVALPPQDLQASITDLHVRPWIGDERLRQMLRTLLIRRFQLRFHYETRIGDVYLLQKRKTPPAFRPTNADPSVSISPNREPIYRRGQDWVLKGATMPELADELSSALKSPVLDQTGLGGAYDYKQRGSDPDPADREDIRASFLAFFPELNLKLTKSQGQISTFVIDGAERPSLN